MLYDEKTRKYYSNEALRHALDLLLAEDPSAGSAILSAETDPFPFSLTKRTEFGVLMASQEMEGMFIALDGIYEGEQQIIDLAYVAPDDDAAGLRCYLTEDMDTDDCTTCALFNSHGKLRTGDKLTDWEKVVAFMREHGYTPTHVDRDTYIATLLLHIDGEAENEDREIPVDEFLADFFSNYRFEDFDYE